MMSRQSKINEIKRLVKNDLLLSVWFWNNPRPNEEPTDTDIFYSTSFGKPIFKNDLLKYAVKEKINITEFIPVIITEKSFLAG